MRRFIVHAVRNGGAGMEAVAEVESYTDGDVLTGAAGLRAIATPGHTGGHCSLLDEAHGVLFTGDAMASVHIATGAAGPQAHPFNESQDDARESLSTLEALDAELVVFGHGEPFSGTPAQAVALARSR
jgi:glyoxylase-like metal-dependent hydrolase (beta-lactamase superfamily II)